MNTGSSPGTRLLYRPLPVAKARHRQWAYMSCLLKWLVMGFETGGLRFQGSVDLADWTLLFGP